MITFKVRTICSYFFSLVNIKYIMMIKLKKIYLLLFVLLFTLTLTITDNLIGEQIISKKYQEENNTYQVEIIYPYLTNNVIDNYIDNYLNEIITNFKYHIQQEGELYIDYDYQEENNQVYLTFYKYQNVDNLINYHIHKLDINLNNNTIKEETIYKEREVYDFYYQAPTTKNKMIALTFDDGPNHNTNQILTILNKYQVKATFFVLGTKAEANPNILKKLFQSGMEIGNHTYSHKLLTNKSDDYIKEEITKTNELIHNITGTYPTLVRPSYGSFNAQIKSSINMPIITWNIDPLDWKYHNSEKIKENILKKVEDGAIILLHDIYTSTVNAVDKVIPELLEQGYDLVTVSELFYYQEQELEKGKVYRKVG